MCGSGLSASEAVSFDDIDFTADDMCCSCGGGNSWGDENSMSHGWSDLSVKNVTSYGFIHGGCGSSSCGLFGGTGGVTVSKTFTLSAHTRASVSMRVWKEGTFDGDETVEIMADGTTVWQSGALQHECITGWTNMPLSDISCHDTSYVCYIDVDAEYANTSS